MKLTPILAQTSVMNCLAILVACLLWTLSAAAFGDSGGVTGNHLKYKPSHDPYEIRAVPIQKAPDFPGVPTYQAKGLKFVDGIYHDQMSKGRKCISCRFRSKEGADAILDWYRNALTSSGWTLEEHQNKKLVVVASQPSEGRTFFLCARDLSGSAFKSEFTIRYIIVPPPALPTPQ
jgi:hypothetical protein